MFASGATAALLGAEDWGICEAAAGVAQDLVDHSPGPVVEVSVIVHRDSVEVLVAGGGVYARREVPADGLFRTKVDCDLP